MKKNDYQTVPVYDYIKLLDKEVKYVDKDTKELKASITRYMLNARRAQTNAKILESLLG